MADALVLRVGCGRWLIRVQYLVALAAGAGLFVVPANPLWTVAALLLLPAVVLLAIRRSRAPSARGRLHLAQDGNALFFTARGLRQARLLPNAWISSALCVLTLRETDGAGRLRCVICRSLNSQTAYRGLLRLLRHAPAERAAALPSRS
jgi:hypothetical protein